MSLPRATFNYGSAVDVPRHEHPGAVSNRYCLETVSKAIESLVPMQARVRARGVDKHVSDALNSLMQAKLALEDEQQRRLR